MNIRKKTPTEIAKMLNKKIIFTSKKIPINILGEEETRQMAILKSKIKKSKQIGQINMLPIGKSIYLSTFKIESMLRDYGIGSNILVNAICEAKRMQMNENPKLKQIVLRSEGTIDTKKNRKLTEMYENFGFKKMNLKEIIEFMEESGYDDIKIKDGKVFARNSFEEKHFIYPSFNEKLERFMKLDLGKVGENTGLKKGPKKLID